MDSMSYDLKEQSHCMN